MSTREVVSIQIGSYSNFVGTHWWNQQESSFVYDPKLLEEHPKEVNHDVLFREGKTLKGDVTYTPRLVLFDLNNSLGSLKQDGTLYDVNVEENIRWVGDVTLHQTPRTRKNQYLQDLDKESETLEPRVKQWDDDFDETELCQDSLPLKAEEQVFGKNYYDLDNDVKVWSDYLRMGLHPRSIFLLKGHQYNNAETPFNIFGLGQQICKDGQQWDEIEDRLRYFTEECDQLQGFHILMDSHNAFAGLASSVLSYLMEEFSNKSRLSFSLTPTTAPDQTPAERSARLLNSALGLYHCSNSSSLYVPVSLASTLWKSIGKPIDFPHLTYKAQLDYHTSSVIAANLDTVTMPYRTEADFGRMNDITDSLNSMGRKVAALYTTLPFPVRTGTSLIETLTNLTDTRSLTPHVDCSSTPWIQSCVVRGVPSFVIKSGSHSRPTKQMPTLSSVNDIIQLYHSEIYPSTLSASCVLLDGLKVGTPFPHIFQSEINYQGFLTDTKRPLLSGVETVPVMATLQSNPEVFKYIDSLEGCISKFNIARHPHFIEAGLEPDDFTEAIHSLKDLALCYQDHADL
ncbi:protein misato homolog 1-like [Physella acuta]|uniref:protein misato homolog 1-like n=1 Tax=Physella acuta TaxID=109671 RepID=UPI0027DD6BC0|nr:protein misato homolog 1-like [Physella acuta]